MKERVLCRKVMAWLMAVFMVISCLVLMGGKNTVYAVDTSKEEVVFMNNGYPYGRDMTQGSIVLVMDVTGEATTYQWQSSINKRGPFTDIEGANESTYQFKPTHGNWYRCVVDGTASRAVKTVLPSGDNSNTWTKPNNSWYISNGVMAYMSNGSAFDIVGLYSKGGTNYMLGTSYNKAWRMYSRNDAEPSSETATSSSSVAYLSALRLSFDPMNTHDLIFDAELEKGQHSFAIGTDANIGNGTTSSGSPDEAVLAASVKNGELQQVAMMGVAKAADATDDTPSFVLAPTTQASYYWIGNFRTRNIFAYNTSSESYIKATAEIAGKNVASLVEGTDSGLTISWTNIGDGGHIGFRFSVGAVADVGAVTGQIDYITEKIIDLDEDASYVITADGETYDIASDMYGEIAVEGTDDNGKSYSLFGKNISISKKDSQDTPADIIVAARPGAPSAPKTLADIQDPTPADVENAADRGIAEIVGVTGDSVTVSPFGGQQYQYSIDGDNWTALDDLNVSDNYVISGLEDGQRVYVRTRYVANTTRPASLWSDAREVSCDQAAGIAAEDITCTYDGMMHSPSITVADSLEGVSIRYSLAADEPYTQAVPEFKNAGTYKVYYLVTADGCLPVFGEVDVIIKKREITAEKILMYGYMSISGVEFWGLVDGDSFAYRTDYTVYAHSTSVEAPKFIANYVVFLEGTDVAANYTLKNTVVEMVHTHDWQYIPYGDEGNKISAYCAQTGTVEMCGYQLEGGRPMVFSMTAEDSRYNGEEYAGLTYRDYVTETTGAKLEISYEGTGDTDYPVSETAPTNAGTYRVIAKIKDTTAQVGFEIQKLDQNAGLSVSNYIFGDSIDGPKITGANEDPVVEYYYTTENSNTEGALWENSRSAEPGTYYMYAKVCATTNYNEYVTQPVQFTVAKKDITPAATTLTVGKVAAKTYGDAKFALSVKCSRNDKKTFASSNTKVVKVDSTGKVTIVGAGKAVVTVSVAANENYKAATAKVTITVNRKAVRVTANDASKYEGKADPKFTFKAEGLVGNDKLTGIVLKRAAGEKAGTYTITASQKQGANPNYNITFAIGRLVIKKAPNVELSGTELCKKTLPFFVMKGKGTGTRIDLAWDKVKGATGYDVYWSYCNGKNNFNKLANVTKSLKYADKSLNSKREYKYFTVAYKMSGGKKVYLGKTNIVHVAMPYASRTNALTVTANKTAVSLAKGKTFKITKKVKLENPKKKALRHFLKNEFYITSNAKVATVSSAGVIKAVGKGTCTVYVMAENGVCARIKVTVK